MVLIRQKGVDNTNRNNSEKLKQGHHEKRIRLTDEMWGKR